MLPDVVPRRRVIDLGTQRGVRQTFALDVSKQSHADIQAILRDIVVTETDRQISIGNEPSRFFVDNREGVSINQVQRRAEVYFGNTLDHLVLRQIENTLSDIIDRRTTARTGRLKQVSNRSYWHWIYVENKNAKGVPVNPYKLTSFPYSARLILMPKLEYASRVNSILAGRGYDETPTRGKNKNTPVKRNYGFMRELTRRLKKSARFKPYTLYAGRTFKYTVPGELYKPSSKSGGSGKQATFFITLMARRKGQVGRGYRRID